MNVDLCCNSNIYNKTNFLLFRSISFCSVLFDSLYMFLLLNHNNCCVICRWIIRTFFAFILMWMRPTKRRNQPNSYRLRKESRSGIVKNPFFHIYNMYILWMCHSAILSRPFHVKCNNFSTDHPGFGWFLYHSIS